MFIEVVSVAGGEESSVMASGLNGRANFTIASISVQCGEGFGGEDCQTVNTCNAMIACNQTLGYCNSNGECICFDVNSTQCATAIPVESPQDNNEESNGDTDLVPIIVGAVGGAVLLLALIIILIVVIVLCRKRSERKKAG